MKFTVQVIWPAKAPNSLPTPDDYEPNAIAVTLAVPIEADRTCGALRNKILRRFTTQAQLQQLRLSDLADKDGALLDLEDTIAELYVEGAASASDSIVRVNTDWAEPASRKRHREEECSRDLQSSPHRDVTQRKRQRRSTSESDKGTGADHSKGTQSRLAEVVIEDSQPQTRGQASPASTQAHYLTPGRTTPAPGGPASSNPAPTSAQYEANPPFEESQDHADESTLFVQDEEDESTGMVDQDDELFGLSDEENTTRSQNATQETSMMSSQRRNGMSSGKVCQYANRRTNLLLTLSEIEWRHRVYFVPC
jgi:hypothetical protein